MMNFSNPVCNELVIHGLPGDMDRENFINFLKSNRAYNNVISCNKTFNRFVGFVTYDSVESAIKCKNIVKFNQFFV